MTPAPVVAAVSIRSAAVDRETPMKSPARQVDGIIQHCDSRTVTVRLSSFCEDRCSECGHCGGGRSESHWELTLTRARHPLLHNVQEGQTLRLQAKIPGPVFSALLLFGCPLLTTVCGALLSWLIIQQETQTIWGGGIGFIASAPLIWAIQHWWLPGEKGFTVVALDPST
jgi:positive regulator of sigma E activity